MINAALIFNMVFDCLSEPIYILDENQKPVFANQSFLKLLSQHTEQLVSIDTLINYLPDLNVTESEEPQLKELKIKGSKNKIKIKIISLPENYTVCKVISNFAEQELKRSLHSQRIETLGMLAGGVAHDFNNILTGLLGHVTYLKNVLPQNGSHSLSIKAIEDGTKRASSLTKEILNFARLETSEKARPVDLNDLIERTCNLLRGAISPQYEVTFLVPEDSVVVLADEAKIAQIIINLAMNARDAIQKGGFIQISLSIVEDKKEIKKVFADKDLSIKKYACLKVADNGSGMSKDVLKRIFEPYFSTKEDRGTGLGLSIVSEIVNLFSGAVNVKTKIGEGTEISVYLPIFEEDSQSENVTDKAFNAELSRGTGNILVVDDEQPVRNVLSLSLEHLGYSVTVAASGPEAIEIYKNSNISFDLVILDMLMPQMTGDQTFFILKEFDPKIKVLLISGYSSHEAVTSVLENGGLGIIQKPFTISDLAARVRQCI